MSFTAEFTIPPAENFRHMDEITDGPYKAAEDFVVNPWHSEFNKGPLYQEALQRSGYFRTTGWHVDEISDWDNVTIFATSTPTEIAGCVLEYLPKQIVKIPWEIELDSTLNALDLTHGKDWLEIAGGHTEAPDHIINALARVVRVTDLCVVQLMPCVAVTGKVPTLLHRSAQHHNSQPTTRIFGQNFN